MKIIRIASHSLVLTVADVGGIAGGALVASKVLGEPNQVWLQLPVAVVFTVGFFWAWLLSLRIFGQKLRFTASTELLACWAASVAWNPLLFVPLHYFTQGYVTSVGNLVALALYQFMINPLALYRPFCLPTARSETVSSDEPPPNGREKEIFPGKRHER